MSGILGQKHRVFRVSWSNLIGRMMSDNKVDVWKLKELFGVFKNAMIWAWYLSAVIIGATLWFFPIYQSRIQTFAFAGAFVLYTLLSVSIAKVDRILGELSR